jgi:hypothetical protein
MPFRSEKQRRYMYAKHPEIAARWSQEYGSKVKKSASPSASGRKGRTRRRAYA